MSTSNTSSKDNSNNNNWLAIGASVGILAIGCISYYLYNKNSTSSNNNNIKVKGSSNKSKSKKKINKEILAEILQSVHDGIFILT